MLRSRSSPLVLGLDTHHDAVVERYWPIIANGQALAINSDWAGSAGLLLKHSDQTRSTVPRPSCSGVNLTQRETNQK
eukprot:COSAG06_NODE_4251_length_4429_cov_50.160970_2_plen_77_part_00